ncbi:MAG: cellulose biosynthesis protein BcsS [Hyphomicrobiaceae bacterium]|nr:MAG: cellulose biosynthesis protein BcsS [Hyphomicrobiaceae bacterium]
MFSRRSGGSRGGPAGQIAALLAALCLVLPSSASSQEPPPLNWGRNAFQLWSGGDYSERHWSAWAGLAYSPFSAISNPGFRLRVIAGGGQFHYTGYAIEGGKIVETTLKGTSDFVEGAIGYQWQLGSWTMKLYGGALFSETRPDAFDVLPKSTSRVQPKITFENWINLSPYYWVNVDGSYATTDRDYWSRARLGWRVHRVLSAGPEISAEGNRYIDAWRAGIFVRYDGTWGEAVLSGGVAEEETHSPAAYLSLNWLGRF